MTEDLDVATDTPRVLFFSGKGGVGKTTLAGTAAVRMGARGERVLVASTDPAHSLSDLFDRHIGPKPTPVAAGVEAVEVDAPATVDGMLEGLGPVTQKGTAAAAADLLKLASHSPGVDEIVSLDMMLRLLEQPDLDAVVLDTAPTGHTLRLLGLPELMDRYFGKLLKLRGTISRFSRRLRRIRRKDAKAEAEELGAELEGAQGRMRRLGELLRDPERCGLYLVTIPEAMSVLETTRTLELLRGQGMPVAAVIVNQVQPEQPDCPFCSARRETHLAQLGRIRDLVGDVPLQVVEAEMKEPRGPEALEGLSDRVWGGAGAKLVG